MSVDVARWTSREWSLRAVFSRTQAVVAAGFVAVSGLAMLIVSPRFTIGGLSLVDDWSGYAKSPHALDRLLRLSYDPAAAGDPALSWWPISQNASGRNHAAVARFRYSATTT